MATENKKKSIFTFGKKVNKKPRHFSTNSFDGNLSDFTANDHSDNNMIVYESWLNKKGKVNTSWKQRYCIAYTDRKLAYYKEANDIEPQGFILLSGVNKIEIYLPQCLDKKNRKNDKENDNSMSFDELNEFKNEFDKNIKKKNRFASMSVKRSSLKGNDYNNFKNW